MRNWCIVVSNVAMVSWCLSQYFLWNSLWKEEYSLVFLSGSQFVLCKLSGLYQIITKTHFGSNILWFNNFMIHKIIMQCLYNVRGLWFCLKIWIEILLIKEKEKTMREKKSWARRTKSPGVTQMKSKI